MNRFIRVWLYRVEEDMKIPDCKKSNSNTLVVKKVRGEFKYYEVDQYNAVRESHRREANEWMLRSGQKVQTLRGYPSFMYDMGYRA